MAEKDVKKNPKDAAAWKVLAQGYQGKNRDSDAIKAYGSYLKLRPKDTSALSQLGALWVTVYDERVTAFNSARVELQALTGPTGAGTGLIGAQIIQDPLRQPAIDEATQKANDAYYQLARAAGKVVSSYHRYAGAIPKSRPAEKAQVEFQLAQSAIHVGDYQTAIDALKSFIRLVPSDPLVRDVRKQLRALEKEKAKLQKSS